jgi:hypothetical protein
MYLRAFAVMVAAAVVAGCVTASNTLPFDEIKNMRLADVNVSFAPSARIAWGEGEQAYAKSKAVPSHQASTAANTPDGQAYMRNTIGGKVKVAMERHVAPKLAGSRPVRMQVQVKSVIIPSTVQRVFIGGNHMMTADVTLVDARTGAVILAYSDQRAQAMAGQGVIGTFVDQVAMSDPVDRVVDSFANQYGNWLMQPSGRVATAQ